MARAVARYPLPVSREDRETGNGKPETRTYALRVICSPRPATGVSTRASWTRWMMSCQSIEMEHAPQ